MKAWGVESRCPAAERASLRRHMDCNTALILPGPTALHEPHCLKSLEQRRQRAGV